MTTIAEYGSSSSTSFENLDLQRSRASANLIVVCLWTLLGVTLTAVLVTLGFGAEISEILALAG